MYGSIFIQCMLVSAWYKGMGCGKSRVKAMAALGVNSVMILSHGHWQTKYMAGLEG